MGRRNDLTDAYSALQRMRHSASTADKPGTDSSAFQNTSRCCEAGFSRRYRRDSGTSSPIGELSLEGLIDGVGGPAGCLGLETRPGRVEGLKTAPSVVEIPEFRVVQVLEQKSLLDGQQRARNAAGGVENIFSPQQTEAEGVEGSGPYP